MKTNPPPHLNSRLRFFEQAPDVDLIAHQGGNGEWPGETTYAFTRALSSGADVIEMDVWGTADNPPVLVLMHSSDISKVTEGSGKVTSLKFKDPDCAFDIRANVPGSGPVTWAGVNLCGAKSVTLNRDGSAGAWVDYDQ